MISQEFDMNTDVSTLHGSDINKILICITLRINVEQKVNTALHPLLKSNYLSPLPNIFLKASLFLVFFGASSAVSVGPFFEATAAAE